MAFLSFPVWGQNTLQWPENGLGQREARSRQCEQKLSVNVLRMSWEDKSVAPTGLVAGFFSNFSSSSHPINMGPVSSCHMTLPGTYHLLVHLLQLLICRMGWWQLPGGDTFWFVCPALCLFWELPHPHPSFWEMLLYLPSNDMISLCVLDPWLNAQRWAPPQVRLIESLPWEFILGAEKECWHISSLGVVIPHCPKWTEALGKLLCRCGAEWSWPLERRTDRRWANSPEGVQVWVPVLPMVSMRHLLSL